MLSNDILLLTFLFGFCITWYWRGFGSRNAVLWVFATGAAGFSVLGIFDGRWQAAGGGIIAGVFLFTLVIRQIRGERPKPGVPLVSGTLFLLLAVVAFLPLYWVPVFVLPEPQGPYAVGLREFELQDDSRLGAVFAKADEPRRLLVRVWYPAETVEGLARRPYATDTEIRIAFSWLATDELSLPSFFFSHLKHVKTFSYEDAPVLQSGPSLPVIFFSHGLTSYVSQNTVLMEHLASKGYAVFSIGHTYDAAPMIFPNGDVAGLPSGYLEEQNQIASNTPPSEEIKKLVMDFGPKITEGKTYDERFDGIVGEIRYTWMTQDRVLVESPFVWLADRLFVEDALAKGAAPDNVADILTRADFTRVGHMGMSFGSSAAVATAYADPRCVAAVGLDGSDFHKIPSNADIPVPFMMLYSDTMKAFGSVDGSPFAFNDFDFERLDTIGLRDDITRLHVKGAKHFAVSDIPLIMRGPLRSLLAGPIDGYLMVGILNDFVGGFFDKYLRGVSNDFPGGEFAKYAGDVVSQDVSGIRKWWLSKSTEERTTLEQKLEQAKKPFTASFERVRKTYVPNFEEVQKAMLERASGCHRPEDASCELTME